MNIRKTYLNIFFPPMIFLFGWGASVSFAQGLSHHAMSRFLHPLGSCEVACLGNRVSSRPRMVFLPSLKIYYAPDLKYNLYLVNKIWYYPYLDKWYQGRSHDGPWRFVPFSKVPEALKNLPEKFMRKETSPPRKPTRPSKRKLKK